MRTSVEENQKLGEIIAGKLNMAKGKTTLMLPLKGVSGIDVEGQAFYDAEADETLFNALRSGIDRDVVELVEMDCDINDPSFATAAAQKLIDLMNS